jgi:hypothetical protein
MNGSRDASKRRTPPRFKVHVCQSLEGRRYLTGANVSVTAFDISSPNAQVAGDPWTGGDIVVTFKNTGTAATQGTIAVNLSLTMDTDITTAPADPGTFAIGAQGTVAPGLQPGSMTSVSIPVSQTLPDSPCTYYVLAELGDSNGNDAVSNALSSATAVVTTVAINSKPDVLPTFSGLPITGTAGSSFPTASNPTITLTNSGETSTEGTITAALYLTKTDVVQSVAGLTEIGTATFSSGIAPADTASISIPFGAVPSQAGVYYVMAVLTDSNPSNDDVLSSGISTASQQVVVKLHAAVAVAITSTPLSEFAGLATTDSVTVHLTNNGPSPTSAPLTVDLYLTQSSTPSAPIADDQVATGTAIALAAGTASGGAHAQTVALGQIPNVAAGTYHLLAVPASGSPNDVSASVVSSAIITIAAPVPNLVATSSTMLALTQGAPFSGTVAVALENTGNALVNAAVDPVTVSLFLTTDPSASQSLTGLAPFGTTQTTGNIAPAATADVGVPVSADFNAAAGPFYILAVLTSDQFSPQFSLLSPSPSVNIGSLPSLVASSSMALSLIEGVEYSGSISVTLTNDGDASANGAIDPISVNVYLTANPDPTQSTSSLPLLGTGQTASDIAPGMNANLDVSVAADGTVAAGSYYLLAVVTSGETPLSQESILASTPSVEVAPAPASISAAINSPDVTASAQSAELITVVYTADAPINTASIMGGNLVVQGPTGATESVLLTDVSGSGNTVTATYSVPAPFMHWTVADSGIYTVNVVADSVADENGIGVAAATSSFDVNVPGSFSLGPVVTNFPASALGGSTLKAVTLSIVDNTSVAISGDVAIDLFASLSPSLQGAIPLTGLFKNGYFRPGAVKSVRFARVTLPSAAGTYYLVAQASLNDGIASLPVVSSGSIAVAMPFVDIASTGFSAPAAKGDGTIAGAVLVLQNNGNISAAGVATVSFSDANADVFAPLPLKLNLKAGLARTYKIKFVIPRSAVGSIVMATVTFPGDANSGIGGLDSAGPITST